MTMFKVGDRVRYTGATRLDLTNGKIYEVVKLNPYDGDPIIQDDCGEERDRGPDEYELVQPAAPAFKVGDRVRVKEGDYWRGIVGTYDGRGESADGYGPWDYFIPDHDQLFHDGMRCCYGGKRAGMALDAFELITPATDELAELRAWKDAAIAKHPDLAPVEPIDPDLAEAVIIGNQKAEEWPELPKGVDAGYNYLWARCALAAIKWARANPR